MSNRNQRAQIAKQTLRILEEGRYIAPSGASVGIEPDLGAAKRRTRLYTPADLNAIRPDADRKLAECADATPARIEVTNETTLHAALRLVERDPAADVLALNFASAMRPGGGFIGGSEAQEESLARASGLYACLTTQPQYYEANRRHGSALYTDYMIYSPRVPVFRDDAGALLGRPYTVSFLTAPAPNAGAVRENDPQDVRRIAGVMRRRIEAVLAIALLHGHRVLVLGAWGCGVFRNDPADAASWFAKYLLGEGRFAKAFGRIVFAVLDHSADGGIITPFQDAFGPAAPLRWPSR